MILSLFFKLIGKTGNGIVTKLIFSLQFTVHLITKYFRDILSLST